MVGEAWTALVGHFEQELRQRDPSARVRPTIDGWGLLRLEVVSAVLDRGDARAAARHWEKKAAAMWECCGEPVGQVRVAGPEVVTVVCPDCARD
jgi:hypothetical protein